MTRERFTNDVPINAPDEDRFGRWPFSQRIAHILATRTDNSSLVIGIYGPWGDGKTSVLNMMAGVLERGSDVICVRFNPWHFDEESVLVRAFFDTLADAFDSMVSPDGPEIANLMRQYARALAPPPAGVELPPSGVDRTADARIVTRSNIMIDTLKNHVDDRLLRSKYRTVVLVDDIDRLERSGIHTLLKLVNLSASFNNFAYVLAIDADVVAAALGERYGDGGANAGRQFLEKIIQIPLHLPDATSADLESACLAGLGRVIDESGVPFSEVAAETFVHNFVRGVIPGLRTPRQVKRYLNAVRFAVPLLEGQVHVLDQLLLEAMRTVYPRVYLCVRDNPDVFCAPQLLAARDEDRAAVKATIEIVEFGLEELGEAARVGAIYLLRVLFPRLNGIFGNTTYGLEWERTWNDSNGLRRRTISAVISSTRHPCDRWVTPTSPS
jgi:predicted KAP-like P-loop ATPase